MPLARKLGISGRKLSDFIDIAACSDHSGYHVGVLCQKRVPREQAAVHLNALLQDVVTLFRCQTRHPESELYQSPVLKFLR